MCLQNEFLVRNQREQHNVPASRSLFARQIACGNHLPCWLCMEHNGKAYIVSSHKALPARGTCAVCVQPMTGVKPFSIEFASVKQGRCCQDMLVCCFWSCELRWCTFCVVDFVSGHQTCCHFCFCIHASAKAQLHLSFVISGEGPFA